MTASIKASAKAYEAWLAAALGGELVEADLAEKHDRMRDGPFPFLRATYWRWAETVLEVCPDLASAPKVLAIGDTHVENFGCWRDAEGRLVWGANDFDDAAVMGARGVGCRAENFRWCRAVPNLFRPHTYTVVYCRDV